ncbi:hypothetical protein SPIROBIBN47_410006 [uncultured spirochete]|jgi:hypothetical protein|uniref:Uncharacterized protein n=1 Tax=uncultured spirochete TaxID=156406 RepID=A0A3P3XL80_9SPIR|nr:hypothetical protein SPIROBIBN47_410006 [uncultured spirochete]
MKIWNIYRTVKGYLEQNLNSKIEALATDANIACAAAKAFWVGWRDPFNLKDYNSVFVVPDTLKRNDDAVTDDVSIAIIAALKSPTPDSLSDQMGIYADAIATVIEDDPTLGGVAFEANVIDFDFSLPAPGSPLIGALTAIIMVRMDRI